jgi:hypothetical protein
MHLVEVGRLCGRFDVLISTALKRVNKFCLLSSKFLSTDAICDQTCLQISIFKLDIHHLSLHMVHYHCNINEFSVCELLCKMKPNYSSAIHGRISINIAYFLILYCLGCISNAPCGGPLARRISSPHPGPALWPCHAA